MWKFRNNKLAISMVFALAANQVAAADNVAALLTAASRAGAYSAPAAPELKQAETLFQRCLVQCGDAQTVEQWRQLGFEVIQAVHGGRPLVLIREQGDARRGRGFYAFRPGSSSTTALQAPHSFKDEHTRQILLGLMAEGDFRAAAWNTVARNYVADGVSVDADMAHLQDTYFLAFSRAVARQFPSGKLVQLHGFSKAKRTSEAGAGADIIISSGSKQQGPLLLAAGARLKQANFGTVLLYPTEVNELGATTNTTGMALRALGHAGFLHLEMNESTRLAILNRPAVRASLIKCLEN